MNGNNLSSTDSACVMNVRDASAFLKISQTKLRRLVSGRRIPYFRLDGRILFSRSAIEKWIETLIKAPDSTTEKGYNALDVASTIWHQAQEV